MNKMKLGKEVEKAFSEGVYADTPKNRKLGRVGMSYKTYLKKKEEIKEDKKNKNRERIKYIISALTSIYGSDLKDLSETKTNIICKYIENIAKETTGKSYSTNYKKGTLDYKKERIANFYIKSGSIDKNASISESVSIMNDILSDILEGQG